jgi:SNF2 family DNA or RNA helicase
MENFMRMLSHSGLQFNKHQYDGVQFCINREKSKQQTQEPQEPQEYNIRGGFILDEMGLGKTITMIGTIVANYIGATLIVVPPILLNQWYNEIRRATGHKSIIFHGQDKKDITIETLNNARIVITTYNAIHHEETKQNLLHQVKWARVIFDEAHHLRNKIKSHEGCLLLKTKIRWLITGTPIQNTIRDFYNLCLAVGISKEFFSKKENHRIILETFVLRRTKKEVGISIPDITHITHSIKWSDIQEKSIAEEIHASFKLSNVHPDKMSDFSNILESEGILPAMMRARQMCIYPKLIEPKVNELIQSGDIDVSPSYLLTIRTKSSKLDFVVKTILENKDNANGKLVFCHYHKEMDELAQRLRNGGISNVATFDGRMTKHEKQQVLSSSDIQVLILQIQTGSEGLNLQENYSEIYFVSPHWNPSIEEQAIARCHRIGQKKEVKVYRFEMEGFGQQQDENEYKRDEDQGENKEQRDEEQRDEEEQYEEQQDEDQDENKEQQDQEEVLCETQSLDEYIFNIQHNKKEIINNMFI